MLLVEIHKPKNFKLNFSRSFLIVEIGEKYALNTLFNILEAKLASKNRKLKSAVVDPPLCYPLVVNVIFKLQFFLDFYAYYDKNALNICALFYRLAVKLTAKNSKIVLSPSIQNFLSKGGKNTIPFIHFA